MLCSILAESFMSNCGLVYVTVSEL